MKSYQYQILRYYPDIVAEEFINVGLILYDQEDRKLFSRVIKNSYRIHSLCSHADIKFVNKMLRNIDKWFKTKGSELLDSLNQHEYKNINSISSMILPPNDASMRFSDVRTGITENIGNIFNELFLRFISKNDKKNELHSRDDKKAWQKYNNVFKKYSIDKKLKKPEVKIKTSFSEIEFDHGWKNGRWNFYKPVSFDLASEDHIKEKVWKLSGMTQELLTSSMDFNLFYLALTPRNGNNAKITDMLKTNFEKEIDSKKIEVVFEDEAENFASQLKLEFEGYEKNNGNI